MAILSWGKPRIIIKKKVGSGETSDYIELNTPIEGSTQLATQQGDKKEAKIEGGTNEAVRYNSDNYTLTLQIRSAKDREKPVTDVNGFIAGEYEVFLQPEDPTAPGFKIASSTMHCSDNWNSDEGGVWEYTFDALSEGANSSLITWGTVVITESGGSITNVAIS